MGSILGRAALAALAVSPTLTHGQSVAPPQSADTAQDEQGNLQEIVVTAQRRSENLQNVPVAVSAITAQDLAATGATSTADLNVAVPGLNFTQNVGQGTPYIRGVGSQSNQPGNESPVAMYVDGVYIPASSATIFDFNNIERVEVLRGPQGTLFGRNSSGGVIQVITRTPSLTESHAEGSVGYGNFDTTQSNAYLSTPLSDKFAMDLAATYRDQANGWGRDLTTGAGIQNGNSLGLRSKLYSQLSDNTDVTLSVAHTRADDSYGIAYEVDPPRRQNLGFYDIEADTTPTDHHSATVESLTGNHRFNGMKFMSITSYQTDKYDLLTDVDGTALPLLNARVIADERYFTQELQLASDVPRQLTWTTGLYYFYANSKLHRDLTGLAFGPPGSVLQDNGQRVTDSYAAYAQGTYKIADLTSFTAGLRFTEDRKRFASSDVLPNGVVLAQPPGYKNTDDASKLTWRLAVDHHVTDRSFLYASYNRGFKSGAYNTSNLAVPPTKPETLDAYEIGSKSTFFNGDARLNLAAFHYNYKQLQVVNLNAMGALVLQNAANARIDGLEGEFEIAPTRRLTLRSSLSWIPKADYEDYKNAQIGGGAPFDASGKRLVRTPKFSGGLGANYWIRALCGEVHMTANYYYDSGWYAEVDNVRREPSYGLFNGSVSWLTPNEHFSVELWGKNLTNKKYYSDLATVVFPLTVAAAPRTYGAQLAYKF
jgi:iron complex outermembrane receptor protein